MPTAIIDGIPYTVAVDDREGLLWQVVQKGGPLLWEQDDWSGGMGETRPITGRGYYYSSGVDASAHGLLRLGPGATTTSDTDVTANTGYFFEARDSGATSHVYLADTTRLMKYSATGTKEGTNITVAGGVAGRPMYANGKWYVPFGSGGTARRGDTIGTGAIQTTDTWADTTWNADAFSTLQIPAGPRFIRVNSTTRNRLDISADTGNITTWTTFADVGDNSNPITDIVESNGFLYAAKPEGLYEVTSDGVVRLVTTSFPKAAQDSENGKGLLAFGDMIFYPTQFGFWRYQIGVGAIPVGPDAILGYSDGPALIQDDIPNQLPLRLRHRFAASIGEWIYNVYGQRILAGRLQRTPKGEFIWHSIINSVAVDRSLFPTSANRLFAQRNQNIEIYTLGADGGPATTLTRGIANDISTIILSEVDFGTPYELKQLEVFSVEVRGTGTPITIQPQVRRDGGSVEDVGAAITTATLAENAWTANDTCYSLFPILKLTTPVGGGHTDPRIMRTRIRGRSPDIIRAVVDASPEAVGPGLTPEDAEDNLRRLQDAQLVSVTEPDTDRPTAPTTFNAYVTQVRDHRFTRGGTVGYGLEVTLQRFIQD